MHIESVDRIFTGRTTVVGRGRCESGPVVVKQLLGPHPTAEHIDRLRREFETLQVAAGPGFVRALACEPVDGLPSIIEEDIGGESVARHLERGPIALADALAIGVAVARALDRVHRAGVIHKDINPANIVWNRGTGAVQLIDFGISSRVSREAPALASPERLEGTLAYIAPEQTGRMNRPIDSRADLYSLGVTLFELLAGSRPFDGADALEFVHAHVARTPPRLRDVAPTVPAMLDAVVHRLLGKAAEERYQTAGGLLADLLRIQEARSDDDAFALGDQDVQQRLRIPGRLYGRDIERVELFDAFQDACGGGLEVVLVAGYSGVGKTALIHELVRPVLSARGAFVAGKFEQFNRGRPYASLLQALGGFVRHLMTESEHRIAGWRERMLLALSGDGVVLTEVLPDLQWIVGPQTPVVELPPTESANRFQAVFRRFVRALAGPQHPLVLFFDDLQWADLPTLTLLESLATDDDAGHLLVVGAYRDNDVGVGHPLTLTLQRIRKTGRRLRQVDLQPLDRATVGAIVADSLGVDAGAVDSLADLVFAKARGNPFFGAQFLEALYRDELLSFDPDARGWTWDADEISTRDVTDNVVDFMAGRIQRFTTGATDALARAAFVGTEFDLAAVGTLLGCSAVDVAARLDEPQAEELVVASDGPGGRFRFVHDRVQQAAYSLVPEDARAATHRDVGRILLTRYDAGEAGLFDVVHALNAGRGVIDDPLERARLVQLNLEAGRRALGAAAYTPAWGFLQAGLELLAADAWQTEYERTLELHLEAASAAYLSHHRADTTRLVAVVLEHGRTELDKVRAYEVEIWSSFSAGELAATLERGLQVLAILGVDLPGEPTQDEVVAALVETQGDLAAFDADGIYGLPLDSNGHSLAVSRILNTLTSPAYFARPSLLPLLAFALVRSGLRHGLAPETQYGFSVYGLILCSVGDLPGGIAAGELAMRLGDRIDHPRLRNLTRHLYLAHIRFWSHPWLGLREPEQEVFRDGHDVGDLLFACFGSQMAGTAGLFGQMELGPLLASMRSSEQAISRLGQAIPLMLQQLNLELTVALREGPTDPNVYAGAYFDEPTQYPELAERGDATNLYVLCTLKTLQCLYLGNPLAAAEAAEANQQWLAGAGSSLYAPMYVWADCMAQLGAWEQIPAERREAVEQRLQANRTQLDTWAALGPMNLNHRVALVDAEWARVFGGESPSDLYPKTIAAADGWVGDQALANELAGRHAHGAGNATVARAYLSEARHLYERWGATAKVEQLQQAWPQLLAIPGSSTTITSTSSGAMEVDALTVVRASRALSQELELRPLVESLLTISLESSGARKAVLVLAGDELIAYAEGVAETGVTVRSICLPALSWGGCPAAVLRYVHATGEAVVLADAAAAGDFVTDPTIAEAGIRSVLCVPLQQQGRLTAILYLENAQTADVFTAGRVELMQTLGAQAAISIENASLYANLEDKVVERTRELAEARRRSDQLLENILPASIAAELKATGHAEPVAFASTSVLFTDFVGFTAIAEQMSAQRLVSQLDEAFSAFDAIVQERGLEKLKTIGDAYMAAGGIPSPSSTHAADCILAGLAMLDALAELGERRRAQGETAWELRVGVHTGPLVAGVIGTRKFAYDVWGETVNTAARMESSGAPGRLNVSEAVYRATEALFQWTPRGQIGAKGLGEVAMYFVDGIRPELSVDGAGREPNDAFAAALAEPTR